MRLSILDLATIGRRETAADALAASVALARRAEEVGVDRIWYAEHHNMASIASSATSVLIAHVAAQTSTIRLGAGGVMLPNHAPLTIAEQYGTLATLHPGRIELGLGRAPGSDQRTAMALRRDPSAADTFPADVVELAGYLRGESVVAGVRAVPGEGTDVPLFILGSSLFGATVAADLGLPYAFASHFAPDLLEAAVARYRRDFQPSEQLAAPHVIAGMNVIAATTDDEAAAQLATVQRRRVALFLGRGRHLDDDQVEALLDSPGGHQVLAMMRHTAAGTPDDVWAGIEAFRTQADADEVIVALASPTAATRLASLDLLAEAEPARAG